MENTTATIGVFLQDPSITSTIITGLFGVATSALGWFISKNTVETKRALMESQLSDFFEPMDYLVSFKPKTSADDLLCDIICLVSEHYKHLPTPMLVELKRLMSLDELSLSDFDHFQAMAASFYNWLRKKLGYPYEKDAIDRRYVPESGARIYAFWDIVVSLAYLTSFMVVLSVICSILPRIPRAVYDTIGVGALSLISILLLYLLVQMIPIVIKQIRTNRCRNRTKNESASPK